MDATVPSAAPTARRALDEVSAYWPVVPVRALAAARQLLDVAASASSSATQGCLLAALPDDAPTFTACVLHGILDSADHPFLRRAAVTGPAGAHPRLLDLMAQDLHRWQGICQAVDAALGISAAATGSGDAAAAGSGAAPAARDPLAVAAPAAAARQARQAWMDATLAAADWGTRAQSLGDLVQRHGLGAEQGCIAFRFEANAHGARLQPIRDVAGFDLDWLEGNRERIEVVERNTCDLLDGFRAHNTLIWGPRGCGKSSLIRGLLARYAERGLRGIEIPAASYAHLHHLYPLVRARHERFIGILDNVALERTDLATRALSTALDGGLEEIPANLVFYATSNFKDLVDRAGERPQGPPATQVDGAPEALRQTADASSVLRRGFDPQGFQRLDERRALDDRFALKVFIDMPTRSGYEALVLAYARRAGIDVDSEELLADFQVWRMRHNHDLVGGRTARDYVVARYPAHVRRLAAAHGAPC